MPAQQEENKADNPVAQINPRPEEIVRDQINIECFLPGNKKREAKRLRVYQIEANLSTSQAYDEMKEDLEDIYFFVPKKEFCFIEQPTNSILQPSDVRYFDRACYYKVWFSLQE